MQLAHYIPALLQHCAPENGFAQDAIERHILASQPPIALTGDLAGDARLIMPHYDSLIETHRAALNGHHHQVFAAIEQLMPGLKLAA